MFTLTSVCNGDGLLNGEWLCSLMRARYASYPLEWRDLSEATVMRCCISATVWPAFLACSTLPGQFLDIVSQVGHRRAAGLQRGMAGHDGVEVGGADGVNGARPDARKAVGDEGQKAVNHVSGCDRTLLRAIDDDVSRGVSVPVKIDV